jgi:CRISPR-associated protein Cas1
MTDTPLVPARTLNEWTYCRRLGILEWVQGEFRDNHFTIEGTHHHRRVDWPGASLDHLSAGLETEDGQTLRTRSVYLESEAEGLVARMDLVELTGDEVIPVDTKRGRPPRPDQDPSGVWEADRVQLCAQALVLRSHGHRCERGYIFYIQTRRRVEVLFDETLVSQVRASLTAFRETAARGELPPPLIQSPKCRGCSLAPICLPDETVLLAGLRSGEEPAGSVLTDTDALAEVGAVAKEIARTEAPEEEGEGGDLLLESEPETSLAGDSSPPDEAPNEQSKAPRVRRLQAPNDDRKPLYVSDPGARVGCEKGLFVISKDEQRLGSVRVRDTSQIVVFGRAQVSTMALREAMDRSIPVLYFTAGGYFAGLALGHPHKNIVLREAQFRVAFDEARALAIAKRVVRSKVRNQRTMLRRNGRGVEEVHLRELQFLAGQADRAKNPLELLGIEGAAAAIYFGGFGSMLRPKDESARLAFDFTTRNRRPPRDPVNALLSLTYGLLTRECMAVCIGVGFDPLMGFYHRPRYGKPALALDLMEEARPLIADSVVLSLINQAEVRPSDFVMRADGCNLTEGGRRKVFEVYERRMNQELVHPIFGYKVTWRRVLEIQARLLSRHILGELPEYRPIETR